MEAFASQLTEAGRVLFGDPVRVQIIVDECNVLRGKPPAWRDRVPYERIIQLALGPRREVYAEPLIVMDETARSPAFARAMEAQGWKVKQIPGDRRGSDCKSRTDPFVNREIYLAANRDLDVVVLVSGDGDFEPSLEYASEAGKRVEVITWKTCFSYHLQGVVDNVTFLEEALAFRSTASRILDLTEAG